MFDTLGSRMKDFESITKTRLVPKVPVMLRLDGKAFHTFTKNLKRPYDDAFHECMWNAAKYLCENISGSKLAYIQSDEISLLLVDYETQETQGYFNHQVQKLVSVSAGMASNAFLISYMKNFPERFEKCLDSGTGFPVFDSRCWNLPKHEVENAFIWRQQDCTRNSISMLAQSHFSHKQLHKVNSNGMKDMLLNEKGINWNDCPTSQKRGVCIVQENANEQDLQKSRWMVDKEIPIFTTPEGREYIRKLVYVGE